MKAKTFFIGDGETKEVWVVQAANEDAARGEVAAAKGDTDGDEFAIREMTPSYSPVNLTEELTS